MARREARIYADIWDDDDFLALNGEDQRLYFFLTSQNDLSHAGVIPLRCRRWSKKSADGDVDRIDASLGRLAAARFVVVDWDAEELFVRSLMRRDRVYRQPNVLRAAADSLALVSSPLIRQALTVEIERISRLDDVHKDSLPILAEMIDAIRPKAIPAAPNPQGNPSREGSRNPSADLPGERGVVTEVSRGFPVPRDSEPHPPAAASERNHRPRARTREEPPPDADIERGPAEEILAEWKGRLKRPLGDVVVKVGGFVYGALAEGHTASDIRETLRRWDSVPRKGPGLLPSILHEVANAPHPGTDLALARASPNGSRRPSTTDQRVADALAIADRLAAQEGEP